MREGGGGLGVVRVRFVCHRLKLTVFSCILNPDWLLLMSRGEVGEVG